MTLFYQIIWMVNILERTIDYFLENIKSVSEIKGFYEPFRWLSNFYPLTDYILYQGIEYSSTEHFYQAMKSLDHEVRLHVSTLKVGKTKKYCSPENEDFIQRPDWLKLKIQVMEFALRQKFSQDFFKTLLLATGDMYIEETNTWNDIFFGCTPEGLGENHLGKIIMKLREELKKGLDISIFEFNII